VEVTDTTATTSEIARRAAEELAARLGVDRHDAAVVLGSGWREAADGLGTLVAEVPMAEVAGFLAPTAAGHGGMVRSVAIAGLRMLAFTGRTHLYETRDPQRVAHAVRAAAACGCRAVVLTNACGGIRDDLLPGDFAVISDHVNFTGSSPLLGAEFVDLSDLYTADLRALLLAARPDLPEGVYAGYWGPNFETPAEIRAYRTLGADLVGMSTVLEAIAARAAGMDVLGLSLVTNRAAGLGGRLDHADVMAEAGRSVDGARRLLTAVADVLADALGVAP